MAKKSETPKKKKATYTRTPKVNAKRTTLNIRTTDKTKQSIQAKAQSKGMTVTDLITSAVKRF